MENIEEINYYEKYLVIAFIINAFILGSLLNHIFSFSLKFIIIIGIIIFINYMLLLKIPDYLDNKMKSSHINQGEEKQEEEMSSMFEHQKDKDEEPKEW